MVYMRIGGGALAAAVATFVLLIATATRTAAATVRYTWTVSEISVQPDGVPRTALGVNGALGFHSPIIVNTSDIVVVTVINNLTEPTSIHWHGMFQNGTNEMDGASFVTQCPIPPGANFTYQFDTTGQVGTYFWHSHYKVQYINGLRGPLVILDPAHAIEAVIADDLIVQVEDWYHDDAYALLASYQTAEADGAEPIFDTGLINTKGQYPCSNLTKCVEVAPEVFNVKTGGVYRLRISNVASFAGFNFSIDSHNLTVIEVDGVDVLPYTVDVVKLNVAQRLSVLVTANQAVSNYWMRVNMFHMSPWTVGDDPAGFNPDVVAILRYASAPATKPQSSMKPFPSLLDDMELQPIPAMRAPTLGKTDANLYLSFNFETRPGDTYQKAYPVVQSMSPSNALQQPIVNGSYAAPKEPTLVSLASGNFSAASLPASSNVVPVSHGQTVQITILNDDAGEHPFHLHGHVFSVLATGTLASTDDLPTNLALAAIQRPNPLRRDVVTVPPCPTDDDGECLPSTSGAFGSQFGYVVIRFVADNPGVWLLHCHIEWHVMAGLTLTIVEAGPEVAGGVMPSIAADNCKAYDRWAKAVDGLAPSTTGTKQSAAGRLQWAGFGAICSIVIALVLVL
ncbi:hypothetical protein HK101_002594 [Irineochytrium annulatum]|nr:hypothetical protein HK101_002594 [Irineochytrium annulatum]